MFKKLIKHGNSFAVIIDKPILEVLNINPDTQLKISTDGVSISIAPADAKKRKVAKISNDEKRQKAYERIIEKYDEAFRILAKK